MVWYTDMEKEIAALTALFKQQLDESAARERRLTELFVSTVKSLTTVTSTSPSPAPNSTPAHVHKPVAVDRPILLSLSTLADFSSWEESWEDHSTSSTPTSSATSRCPNCGRGPHAKSACPANGRKCNGCKGRGYFAAFCLKKKKSLPGSDKKIGQLKLRQTASPDTLQATLDVSTRLNTESSSTVLAWVQDTGSDVDAIGLNQLDQLGGFPENLLVNEDIVTGANGQELRPLGKIDTTLQLDETTHDTTVHVYKDLTDALLPWRTLMTPGVLPSDWPRVTHVRRLASPSVPPPDINEVRHVATSSAPPLGR